MKSDWHMHMIFVKQCLCLIIATVEPNLEATALECFRNSEGSMQCTHSGHWAGLGPSGSPHGKVRHNCAWSFGKIKTIFFESPPVLEHCNKPIVVLANYLVIRVA